MENTDPIDTGSTVTVGAAIGAFTNIMRSLSANDKQAFLLFIKKNWTPEETEVQSSSENYRDDNRSKLRIMNRIILDIRTRVPFDGILPSENIVPPVIGKNSDCDPGSTKHVDAFLYDNKEVGQMIDRGDLDNFYCADCYSHNVKEYTIISHSMSVSAMLWVFIGVLPPLEGKTVLDIGSRLGAVLYGAHVFTDAKKIIGVEMNKELCKLQLDMVQKYKMNDRIEIVNKKIEECPEIVENSNVIIMNNPFEFYMQESVHIEIWKFLKAHIKKGTILVVRPPIETTFETLKTGISIDEWVTPYESEKIETEPEIFEKFHPIFLSIVDSEDHCDINFYKVL